MLIVFATTRRPTENQHERQGIELFCISRNALARDTAYMRADKLDRDHERRCEKHCPKQAIAKLGTGLRIGRDS